MPGHREHSYNMISKALHWGMAGLVFGLLAVGFYMEGLALSPDKLRLYGMHKAFGLLVLGLALVRLLWRFFSAQPPALQTHKPWEKRLSKLTHLFLYGALVAMPLSGWVMSSAGDFPISFFGLFEMPDIVPKNKVLFEASGEAHEIMAFILLAVLALHMAGAFKHHFIDRDETLRRMSRAGLGFWGGGGFLLIAGFLWLVPFIPTGLNYVKSSRGERVTIQEAIGRPAHQETMERPVHYETAGQPAQGAQDSVAQEKPAHVWQINKEASFIQFNATQYGQGFTGAFKRFSGRIAFDPADLDHSAVNIVIDITSIETGSNERDEQARAGAWFDVARFPQARFVSKGFSQRAPNRYDVQADLTIRDVSMAVNFPFSLKISEDEAGVRTAVMDAQLSLNRLDFGLGQGEWQSTQVIGDVVQLTLHIEARQD